MKRLSASSGSTTNRGGLVVRARVDRRPIRAGELLRTLRQSRFDNSRDAEMIALTTVDLLIFDDFAQGAALTMSTAPRAVVNARVDRAPTALRQWISALDSSGRLS